MSSSTGSGPVDGPVSTTPPVPPPVRIGVWHIAAPGALICLVVSIVLLFFLPQLRAANAAIWLWTFVAATGWSLVGLSIYGWQRRAARRGARGVSRSALDEVIGRGGR